jgi:hypothetical protein
MTMLTGQIGRKVWLDMIDLRDISIYPAEPLQQRR